MRKSQEEAWISVAGVFFNSSCTFTLQFVYSTIAFFGRRIFLPKISAKVPSLLVLFRCIITGQIVVENELQLLRNRRDGVHVGVYWDLRRDHGPRWGLSLPPTASHHFGAKRPSRNHLRPASSAEHNLLHGNEQQLHARSPSRVFPSAAAVLRTPPSTVSATESRTEPKRESFLVIIVFFALSDSSWSSRCDLRTITKSTFLPLINYVWPKRRANFSSLRTLPVWFAGKSENDRRKVPLQFIRGTVIV